MVMYDRIDRMQWSAKNLAGKVDAHLLRDGLGANWRGVQELLRLMYNDSVEYSRIAKYREKFFDAVKIYS